jgi:hypothetical protein
MIEDIPAIRDQLNKHWQKAGIDLVKHGFRPEAIFETMFAVGLAGYVEMHGKEASAQKLVAMAQRLSDQVQKEAEAAEEAKNATKN